MAYQRRSLLTVVVLSALATVRADITTVVGTRAAKPAKLHQPAGVATLLRDGKLHTWVADTQNNRIQYVSETGDMETVAGTGEFDFFGDGGDAASAKLAWPHGVAVRDTCHPVTATHNNEDDDAEAGVTLYIADTYNHRVRRVVDGRIETIAGNGKRGFRGDGGAATSARLSHPHAVAVLPADCAGWSATASSATNGKLTTSSAGYSVWIADTYNNRVRRIDPDGIITTVVGAGAANFAGDNGAAIDASLAWPMGLTVMPSARAPGSVVMVIADTYNHRVRMVNSAGIITTMAGNGKEGFSQDGPDARQESLSHPFGVVAVRADPNLDAFVVWFTDSSGHKLRQIGLNRALHTLAGKAWPGYRGDDGPAYDAVLNQPKGLALVPTAASGNGVDAVNGADDTVHLLFADCYNHAVRRLAASLNTPVTDPRAAQLRLAQEKDVLARKLLNGGPSPTAVVSATHTPTPSSSPTADVSSTHTPTPSPTADVSSTHTPTPSPTADVSSTHTPTPSSSPTADVSSTHTPTPSWTRTATRSPSTTVSALSTPSGTPSVSLSITPLASASAAPSVPAGSTLVFAVLRLHDVGVPCDVLARNTLFISLMRLSFALSLNVDMDRVHVDVVVDGNCSSTMPLRRQLQSGGSAPVNVNVGIITSPTQADANTIDAVAVANNMNRTPIAVLLQVFLRSALATSMGITSSSVELSNPASISTTPVAPKESGLSDGALAGIVIGSVAFVGIIGVLVTLVIMRHHNRATPTNSRGQGAQTIAARQQHVQPHTTLEMPATQTTAQPPVQPGTVTQV